MAQEQHSYPIFSSDWGADEELLLISGLIQYGLGNWIEVAEHVGTRTKDECEKHYLEVFLGAGDGPEAKRPAADAMEVDFDDKHQTYMPPMDRSFHVDKNEFQQAKKARIEDMRKPHAIPAAAAPLVSAPTNHEVGGFMPGRLEFEHEVDNEAEMAVKDMEFGLVFKYGGDEQPQAKVTRPLEDDGDEEDEDEEEDDDNESKVKEEEEEDDDDEDDEEDEAPKTGKKRKQTEADLDPPQELEDEDELEVKLAMLNIYFSKLDKRESAKDLIFDRALTEHKRILANERRRPKDERDLVQRYKVFAKLQTAQDFESLIEGLIFEQQLRRRIAELQEYRRVGVTTAAEAEHYETAKAARAGYRPVQSREQIEVIRSGARINAGQHRFLHGTPPPGSKPDDRGSRDPTPRVPGHGGRKPPTPLNLANAASLDLLSTEEQNLCSTLRVLPKPYLMIKETYLRENERRKGLLKRRDARKMMKIDVNKSGRIFDFLVANGILKLMYDPTVKGLGPGKEGHHVGVPIDITTGKPLPQAATMAPAVAHMPPAITNGGP
jgi:transcriptional adapter 2-alpha